MLLGPQQPWYGPLISDRTTSPINAAHFTKVTGITPTSLYRFDQASGSLIDIVSGFNLPAVGTPVARQVVGGRIGVVQDSAGDGYRADVNDPGLSSFIIAAVATHPNSFASLPRIWGRMSDTAFPCFVIYRANNVVPYVVLLCRDAVSSVLITDVSIDVINPNRPVLYMGQFDRTANVARLVVCDAHRVLTNMSGSTAGFLTLSGGVNPTFGTGEGNGLSSGPALNFGFYATGAQTEGTTKLIDIANRLGWGK